jgi:hypothetical protein
VTPPKPLVARAFEQAGDPSAVENEPPAKPAGRHEKEVRIVKIKPGMNAAVLMAVPTVVLLICILVVLRLHGDSNPAAEVVFKAQRVDRVSRMQLDLASASEAEKSAVLAVTDEESKTFADQARASSARVVEESRELKELLTNRGARGEMELLAQFTDAFAEFQRIDDDLLALAVKNTNVKAYGLAFGPAALAVREMNAALTRLLATNADAPAARTAMPLAFDAEIAALRIQTLLAPHIAEESDKKMDELEASMATEDAEVHKDLEGLAALPKVGSDADLATAAARYAEFGKTRTQILALSRENTNVRSLSISLNEKRKVMLVCQVALNALQQAILAEPIAGVMYGAPPKPR